MDAGVPCSYCTEIVEEGDCLDCSSCDRKFHFKCGTGLSNVSERTISTYLNDSSFRCYLCCIAEKNSLITTVIILNQKFNENKPVSVPNEANEDDGASSHASLSSQRSQHSSVRDASPHSRVGSRHSGGDGRVPPPGIVPPVLPPGRVRPPLDRPASDAGSDAGRRDFHPVIPPSEVRRVKRCKGMLFGLKHIPTTVKTLLILDSNGRDIKGEHIDGTGAKICVKQIGGLCVSAATEALKEAHLNRLVFPNIKDLAFGLGTNDHLHRGLHPGEKQPYITELDAAVKKVFPAAKVHFILPFTAIKGLSVAYIKSLGSDIKSSNVNWKVHIPPSMKGKLVSPHYIHLTPDGRDIMTSWLKKIFNPKGADATPPVPTRPLIPPPSSDIPNNSRARSGNNVLHPPGELDLGKVSVESMLKDKLLQWVLGQTNARPPHHLRPPPWQYIDY